MDLYSEIILDHFKNPKHKGDLPDASASAEEVNPLCGDKIKFMLKIDAEENINEIKFEGVGCAISQACADLVAHEFKGKKISALKDFPPSKIGEILGIEVSPGRIKCALLGLITAQKAGIIAQAKNRN